jgi:hypothetical protein
MGQLMNDVQRIFEDQTTVFKFNLCFGFVLFNNETEQLQYHHSSANNDRVFDAPFQIPNRDDLAQVREALQNTDAFEWARQQRPNSKWVVMDTTKCYLLHDKASRSPHRTFCTFTQIRVGEYCDPVARLQRANGTTLRGQTMFLPLPGYAQRLSPT